MLQIINTNCSAAVLAPGWIYFVSHGDRIKIGFSQRPFKRFYAIKGTAPVSMTMLGAMRGNRLTEQVLQRQWAGQTRRNEWVDATEALLDFIARYTDPVTKDMDEEGARYIAEESARNLRHLRSLPNLSQHQESTP